jgi:hypothetical protein
MYVPVMEINDKLKICYSFCTEFLNDKPLWKF